MRAKTQAFNGRQLDTATIEKTKEFFGVHRSREIWPDFRGILRYDPNCVSIRINSDRVIQSVWLD